MNNNINKHSADTITAKALCITDYNQIFQNIYVTNNNNSLVKPIYCLQRQIQVRKAH